MKLMTCVGNLKDINFNLRKHSIDHDEKFVHETEPFRSERKLNEEGFDDNALAYFQELIDHGLIPLTLKCPSDDTTETLTPLNPSLKQSNISYLYRSGDLVSMSNPSTQVIVYCPIHHNVALADGSVRAPTIKRSQSDLDSFLNSRTADS